jgi:ribonuclease HI
MEAPLWSAPLLPGTSVQLAELTALTQALKLGRRKRTNIYTNSKYAFLVLHVRTVIWRERHFLTAIRSPIKYGEIDQLLFSVHFPSEMVTIHTLQASSKGDQ